MKKKSKVLSQSRAPRSSGGFALIVAMTLMAFLVMLLVGISTLVTTETQAATNENLKNLARQYARMGLGIALKELQRTAGTDQRVTATGAIYDSDPTTRQIEGVNQPFWTGVWQTDLVGGELDEFGRFRLVAPFNSNGSDNSAFQAHRVFLPSSDNPKGQAVWLVSGNEEKDPALGTAADMITPTSDLSGFDLVHLFNHPSNLYTGGMAAYERLQAPLMDILLDDASGTARAPIGRYAWAVIDENVKARINLVNQFEGGSLSDWDERFRKTSQQIELDRIRANLGDENAAAEFAFSDYLDTTQNDLLSALVDSDQLSLLATQDGNELLVKNMIVRLGHDLTTHSVGLLTNPVEGGLKRDLSLAFEMDDGDFNNDNFFAPNFRASISEADLLYTGGEKPLPRINGFRFNGGAENFANTTFGHRPVYEVPALRPESYDHSGWPDEPKHYGPTFHVLRDFYRLYKPVSSSEYTGIREGPQGPSIDARAYHAFNADIEDRVDASKLLMDSFYRFETNNPRFSYYHMGTSASGSSNRSQWRLLMRPEVAPVLPIRVNFAYRIGVSRVSNNSLERQAGVPDYRLALTLEPYVALWNPYNVAIEMEALRFNYRWDSGVEVVIETDLKPYSWRRLYKVEEEVKFDNGTDVGIYRLYHTDGRWRRGIRPDGTPGNYQLDEDFRAFLALNFPTELTQLETELSQMNLRREVVWARVGQGTDRDWTIAAHTPMGSIYSKDQRFMVVSPETADTMLRSNSVSGVASKLRLEPGRIAVFGPVNDEPLRLNEFSGNTSNTTILLTERYEIKGGAYFDGLRSLLEDGHKIRQDNGGGNFAFEDDSSVSITRSPLIGGNENNPVESGDGRLHSNGNVQAWIYSTSGTGPNSAQRYTVEGSYDQYVDVEGTDTVRITIGAPGMGGDAESIEDGQTFAELYDGDHFEWSNRDDPQSGQRVSANVGGIRDVSQTESGESGRINKGKAIGNAGLFIGAEMGFFQRSGQWQRWANNNSGTFRGATIRQGFGLQWSHNRDFPYGMSQESVPPEITFPNATGIPELFNPGQETRAPILDVVTHVRTNEDPLRMRVLANNNVRYAFDVNADGVGGFDGINANHMEVRSTPREEIAIDIPPIDFSLSGGRLTGFWGESLNDDGGDDALVGQSHVVLFDLPRNPMTSLAQFQHAHIDWTYNSPTYIVGNAEADPFVRPEYYSDRIARNHNSGTRSNISVKDYSYLMNQALFDEFYFSTLAPRENGVQSLGDVIEDFVTDPAYRLPNGRMRLISTREPSEILELLDPADIPDAYDEDAPTPYEAVAAFVGVEGAFNVNSTSVEAWTALLGSLSGLTVDFESTSESSAGTEGDVQNAIFRMHTPYGAVAESFSDNERWRGFRALSESEVRHLAERIVHEVKVRGPFTSLSDFVNRRLVKRNATDPSGRSIGYTSLKGTLQAAIDHERLGIQVQTEEGVDTINGGLSRNTEEITSSDVSSYPVDGSRGTIAQRIPHREHWLGGESGSFMDGTTASITQADLLQALAPVLTARSDTFRIRAYGEVINPLTGDTEASAWCEAIVQRTPEFVVEEGTNGTDFPWTDQHKLVNVENLLLGRRFEIVSFRWLDETEV